MSDLERKQMLKLIAEDAKHVQAFFSLLNHFGTPGRKYGLVRDFGKALEARLKGDFPGEEWKVENEIYPRREGPGIYLRSKSWPEECRVGINADKLEAEFAYGVICDPRTAEELKTRFRKALDTKFPSADERTQESKWWPWFRNAPRFKGISVHRWLEPETFIAMQNGQADLVEHFANLFEGLVSAVKDALAEHNGQAVRSELEPVGEHS